MGENNERLAKSMYLGCLKKKWVRVERFSSGQ